MREVAYAVVVVTTIGAATCAGCSVQNRASDEERALSGDKQYRIQAEKLLDDLERLQARSFTPEEREKLRKGAERIAMIGTGELPDVPAAIAPEVLDQTADSDLVQLLFDFVLTIFHQQGRKHDNTLMELPLGLRMVYLLTVLDGQIRNNGMGAYFAYDYHLIDATFDALDRIGAHQRAALLEKAVKIYESAKQNSGAEEASHCPELLDLAIPYYEFTASENLDSLLVAYIRAHPEQFMHSLGASGDQK